MDSPLTADQTAATLAVLFAIAVVLTIVWIWGLVRLFTGNHTAWGVLGIFISPFALAGFLGFATDVMSGSLLGQHALLRLLAFASAALASRQLNLRGPLPLAVFAAGVTVAYGVGVLLLTRFFAAPAPADVSWAIDLVQHAGVNAIFAPWISNAVERLSALSGEDEAGRRPLRLDPRRASP